MIDYIANIIFKYYKNKLQMLTIRNTKKIIEFCSINHSTFQFAKLA